MRGGRLRHKVTVQTDEAPEADVPAFTGTLVSSLPCRVSEVSGDKAFRGQQVEAHVTHIVEHRFVSGLSNRLHRYLWGSRILNIEKVLNPDGRQHQHVVHCSEIAN